MKIIILLSLFGISMAAFAQKTKSDTINYVHYTDKFGKQKKAVIAYPTQILIVHGDSIYTVSNEIELKRIIEKQGGFHIINNPDSISSFLRKRIKGIMILTKGKK